MSKIVTSIETKAQKTKHAQAHIIMLQFLCTQKIVFATNQRI